MKSIELLLTASGVHWLILATNVKETIYKQRATSRLIFLLILVLGYILLYSNESSGTIFASQLIAQTDSSGIAGVILTFIGVCFAVEARNTLGHNWSGSITLKKDHELIRTGPYALVRHPIYTGILCALLGLTVANGEIRAFILLFIFTIGLISKLKIEEQLMLKQFPDEYPAYMQKVKMLVPFVL